MPLGTTEILIIAAALLLVFGSTAIPKFARSLREARRELTAPNLTASDRPAVEQ